MITVMRCRGCSGLTARLFGHRCSAVGLLSEVALRVCQCRTCQLLPPSRASRVLC